MGVPFPADAVIDRCVELALDCVGREFPNSPLSILFDESETGPPRSRTPAFFGCFDWHSAVHGHWSLARALRCRPTAAWAGRAVEALKRNLTPGNLDLEYRHLSKPGREGFERPYGLAWLLLLCVELRGCGGPLATIAGSMRPLEDLARDRIVAWLEKLTHPIRSGEHGQSAFAMRLLLTHAVADGGESTQARVRRAALRFYSRDEDLPIDFEPSGHDFLSPSLAEADLMRVVLPPDDFGRWLSGALPRGYPLPPENSPDRSDGKLAHLDGLNLSRAWMLSGVATALPADDPRRADFESAARRHADAGLDSLTGRHYAGTHWLGSFAMYFVTRRGIETSPGSADFASP